VCQQQFKINTAGNIAEEILIIFLSWSIQRG